MMVRKRLEGQLMSVDAIVPNGKGGEEVPCVLDLFFLRRLGLRAFIGSMVCLLWLEILRLLKN